MVPTIAPQGHWAARGLDYRRRPWCPKPLNDPPAPHGWVTSASGQNLPRSFPPPEVSPLLLVPSSVVGFLTSHLCDQLCKAREGIICSFTHSVGQSVSQQTLECLLCTRHCAWCWGYYSEKIDSPCRGRHSRQGEQEGRSGGYKGVGASVRLVAEIAWGHDPVQAPASEGEEKRYCLPAQPLHLGESSWVLEYTSSGYLSTGVPELGILKSTNRHPQDLGMGQQRRQG